MDDALREQLIRRGAEVELVETRERLKVLEQRLQDLEALEALLARGPRPGGREPKIEAESEAPAAKKSGRRPWTPAQRRAAAKRMKAYWTKRKSK